MALITCTECGTEVSTSAKACPKCGASPKAMGKQKKQIGRTGKIVIGAIALGMAALAITAQNAPVPVQTEAEAMAERLNLLRIKSGMAAAVALKRSLRNPDSVTYEMIRSNEDGSLICILYRAQNGFGGMNRGNMAFIDDEPTDSRSVWNKRCAQAQLYDITSEATRMMARVGS